MAHRCSLPPQRTRRSSSAVQELTGTRQAQEYCGREGVGRTDVNVVQPALEALCAAHLPSNRDGHTDATSAPGLGSTLPHLRQDWARPCHICARTELDPATSAPGLSSTLPHLRQDWARPCHICIGTGLTAATSASGLGHPYAAASAPGLGSQLPHLHQDWARPCHICAKGCYGSCPLFRP
jgi:hypothetical protein